MKKIKTYLISIGISLGLILIFDFFINMLNYFDLLNISVYKVLIVIMTGLSIAIGSYLIGTKTIKKGYIEGLKFGIIICLILFILTIIISNISINTIIYYLILIIFSIFGSMIGINKKQEK